MAAKIRSYQFRKSHNGRTSPFHPGLTHTLLHIDDDPEDIFLLQVAFSRAKLPVRLEAALSGRAAVEYLYLSSDGSQWPTEPRPKPNVIVLDLKMPEIGGFDLLKWLRNQDTLRNTPVYILTSSEDSADKRRAFAAGASGYFLKTPGFHPLVEAVADFLGLTCETPSIRVVRGKAVASNSEARVRLQRTARPG